ncbi:MAG: bifunctional hydroxymethylpyrimidine kinase/phosphomethylpyrimidine kinase [Planctomycetes bacterium]|nr:bifunctional hydroxymethylpyrimidine kinase/phosphomethylpyrimidine kinase [Planctomycetota bacterium]
MDAAAAGGGTSMGVRHPWASDLSGTTLAVLGDPIADVYILGRPTHVSREAPVLVIDFESEQLLPGGAANTANNLLSLGAKVVFAGACGEDERGERLRDLLRKAGADVEALLGAPPMRTVAKMRVLAGDAHRTKQHIVKVNYAPGGAPAGGHWEEMRRHLDGRRGALRGVVLSDYGYGSIGPSLISWAKSLPGIPVVADSRHRLDAFSGITAVTPNEEEAGSLLGRSISGNEEASRAARDILERLGTKMVLLTRGNAGMVLAERSGRTTVIPAAGPSTVTDVSGAGDTVTAVFTLALSCGADPVEAARLSNEAAGVVVLKPGVATLTRAEWGAVAGFVP